MKTKTVYQTNHLGLYVGPAQAEESPLEPGVFLIPAGCVETPPPTAPEFKVACWMNREWQLLDYFGGLIVYNIHTAEPMTIEQLGPLPNGYTLKKPAPHQLWKNGQWVDDLHAVLASLHSAKLKDFQQRHDAHIDAGLTSSALGAPHLYRINAQTQLHLFGLVLTGMDADFPCQADQRELSFHPHTNEQLAQVAKDLILLKQGADLRLDNLTRAATAAVTAQDLEGLRALDWSTPT